jgi:hypothetical protein
VLAKSDNNTGSAGVSRRGTWMHLPTSLTMPLPLPLHTTSTCQIHWCWSCACVGPQEWVDLMLEELAASLVVSWPAGAPVPRCPPTTTTVLPVSMTPGEQPDVMEAEARPDSSNTPRCGGGHRYPTTARGTVRRHQCRGAPRNPSCGHDHPFQASWTWELCHQEAKAFHREDLA